MLLKNRSKVGNVSSAPQPKSETSTFSKPTAKPGVGVPVKPDTGGMSPRGKRVKTLIQGAKRFVQQEVESMSPEQKQKFKGKGSRLKNEASDLQATTKQIGPGVRDFYRNPA
jgi:hypothetical protein